MTPRSAAAAQNQRASAHPGRPAERHLKPGTGPRKLQRRKPPSLELGLKPRDCDVFCKINDSWWWELSGVMLGVAIVGVIVAVLVYHNDKVQPEWPIKLTSLIAILATLAKGALLMAVTTAISQQKWLWYSKNDRRLLDMDYFDVASRSAWGSLVLVFTLVFKVRKWSPAIFGSIILLSSILFQFAAQQAIATPIRTSLVASNAATVQRMQSFSDLTHMADSRVGFSEPLTRASTLGIIKPNGKPNLQPICPGDSCTWPSFSSVGICSRCVNIMGQVKLHQKCNTDEGFMNLWCTIQLPNSGNLNLTFGYSGNGPQTYFNATIYNTVGQWPNYHSIFGGSGTTFAGIPYPIYAVQGFDYKISQLTETKFQYDLLDATECAVFGCVKTYDISVTNGTSRQIINSTWYNSSTASLSKLFPGSSIAPPDLYLNPPATNGSDGGASDIFGNHRGLYKLAGEALGAIGGDLNTCFADTITISDADDLSTTSQSDYPQWVYSEGNLSQTVENVALALTDYIQTSEGSESVTGRRSISETYVHLRFAWLALPLAVAGSSFAFLLLTMFTTRKRRGPLWKGSNLALLYHGLEAAELLGLDADSQYHYPPDNLSEMELLAKKTRYRLGKQAPRNVWKLVRASSPV